ncbi:hypothetical protein BJP34_05475 [Moorena producens PAL-8-15-08-1]|uniref:Uncharacterized protein n=1 Tax=Moorena producens PAL-8-15-08-1 TaxID=1458985 RepID=A0A1D8TMV0_9CYAN|nr:hypothetical protein BJP34_05475 [Moorena producens PAL-8-15-08-1]
MEIGNYLLSVTDDIYPNNYLYPTLDIGVKIRFKVKWGNASRIVFTPRSIDNQISTIGDFEIGRK